MFIRLLLLSLIVFSCGTARQVETRLYFGQLKRDGGTVSEKEWNEFVEKYVGRVFPEGNTIENATGNWFDTSSRKLITEPSKVVVSINRRSRNLDRQIDSLCHWYKLLYDQQSVLRVDRKVKAALR